VARRAGKVLAAFPRGTAPRAAEEREVCSLRIHSFISIVQRTMAPPMTAAASRRPRLRPWLFAAATAAAFVLLCCCIITIPSATAAPASSDPIAIGSDSLSAVEWNRLGLSEAAKAAASSEGKQGEQMAVATRMFHRAVIQQREEVTRAQKELRAWRRDLRAAQLDEEELALELAEAEAAAGAGGAGEGDDEDAASDLAALTAESEAASREVASLRGRVVSARAALRKAKALAADFLNNKAVSLMRRAKMTQALHVLRQALRMAEHVDARKNLQDTRDYLRRTGGGAADETEGEQPVASREKSSSKRTPSTKRSKETPAAQAEREAREERRRARRGLPPKKKRKVVEPEPEEDDEEQEETEQEQEREQEVEIDESVYDRPAKRRPQRPPTAAAAASPPAQAPAAKAKPLMDRPRRPTRNPRPKLPRVHMAHMGLSENAEYAAGRAPFVLVGAMDGWNMTKFLPRALAQHFPASTVDFYPHNMDQVTVRPFLVPLSQAFSEQSSPSGSFPQSLSAPGSYIQWNVRQEDWEQLREWMGPPGLLSLFRLDDAWLMPVHFLAANHFGGSADVAADPALDHQCLNSHALRNAFALRTHWRMVLIGSRGAGMFNHQDVLRTASFQAQVHGAKRWHLCAPSESRVLYGAGQVDTFDPDYTRFPLYEQSRHCFDDVVTAGEMVFYPADWWHQTENVQAPSVALTDTIMDGNNHELIIDELRQECAVGKYNWGFSKELCESLLQHCFPFWRKHFGKKTSSTLQQDEEL